MKTYEIRQMTFEEVVARLRDAEEELSNLRFRLSARKELDNPLKVRQTRREIARLKTILHEHEIGLRRLASGPITEETKPR